MRASASFAIDAELQDVALSAAQWLPGFYPNIQVTVLGRAVKLGSDTSGGGELAAVWAAALANERLLELGRERRRAAWQALAE